MGQEEYLNAQNKLRKEALVKQDAITYYTLCNDLGIHPEDRELFDKGLAEFNHRKNLEDNLEHERKNGRERNQ